MISFFGILVGHIHFRDYIAPIWAPFRPLKTKIFENEFQIRVLRPKFVLSTKIHRNQMIFILLLFGGSYPFLGRNIALFHSRFTP